MRNHWKWSTPWLIWALLAGSSVSAAQFVNVPYGLSDDFFPKNLPPNQCLHTDADSKITSTGSDCGTGSGGVTSVSGTANQITVVNGTTTPVISIPSDPQVSGNLTTNDITVTDTTTNQCLGTNGSNRITTASHCVTSITGTTNQIIANSGGAVFTLSLPFTFKVPGTFESSSNATFDTATGTSCAGFDSTKKLVSNQNCVTAITGTTPITVSTPSPGVYDVEITSPIPVAYGGTGTASATAGNCVDVGVGGHYNTDICNQWTLAGFIIPSVGGTVTLTGGGTEQRLFSMLTFTPIFVTDGTHAIQGYANAASSGAGPDTVVLHMNKIIAGSVGDSMAGGAHMMIGNEDF